LQTATALLFADLAQGLRSVSVLDWLHARIDRIALYPYPLVIWLGCLSNAIENGLAAPEGWRFRFVADDAGARWETPTLTDIVLEARAV
jgi:hypothetical protein